MRCVLNWRRNVGQMGKGGECDDLVRFLFDLFCGRILLQLLFICVRKLTARPAAFAALSRARGRALADGAWSGGAGWISRRACSRHPSSGAAAWRPTSYSFAI